jgi:hypothetical protein
MNFAWIEALRAEGHDVTAWCWGPVEPPDLPSWAQWKPLPDAPVWAVKSRALIAPRTDAVRLKLDLPDGAVGVADDTISYPAIRGTARPVANINNSLALDRRALHGRRGTDLQDVRAERRLVRAAPSLWVSSSRVRDAFGRGVVVPSTLPLPDEVVPPVEAPVVGILADWRWQPNRVALGSLLDAWTEVRDRVPGALLLVAGRGTAPVGVLPGVQVLGEVPTSADLLSQVALLAFPCPDTSGAKLKSFDTLAHEVALVTTPAGAEGLPEGAAYVVPAGVSFADELVRLLNDGQQRRELARRGRELLLRHHSPRVAALARLDALASG